MFCAKCGSQQAEDSKFCVQCGASLEPRREPAVSQGEMRYAGFWLRVVAYLIDLVVLAIPTWLLARLGGPAEPISIGEKTGTVTGIYALLFTWFYYALLESSVWQATVGKKALGLLVTDYEGRRISFWRATGRFFGNFLCALTLGIGYLMVGWTKRKQGLHDKLAQCLIVRNSRY